MIKGHYHLLTIDSDERIYLPMTTEDESKDEGIARWIAEHPEMINRQRNRDRMTNQLRESISGYRTCRPSSWYRDNETNGTPATKIKRRK